MTEPKRRALGRGLSALLTTPDETSARRPKSATDRTFFHAPVEDIHRSLEQPRKRFPKPELEELAQSIRAHGIIQPLAVRPRKEGGYFLIAGERRWRAAQRAGLTEVPVVVQKIKANAAFERALIENIQRADLNPIETAEAYSRLIKDFELTQDDVAERVGKDRSSIANSLRLLKLPPKVRIFVEEGQLSMGHARALLGLESAAEIETTARAVLNRGLSVRATERLVKSGSEKPTKSKKPGKTASVRDLEEKLTRSLGWPVRVHHGGKGGRLEIHYSDLDDLDRLRERLAR